MAKIAAKHSDHEPLKYVPEVLAYGTLYVPRAGNDLDNPHDYNSRAIVLSRKNVVPFFAAKSKQEVDAYDSAQRQQSRQDTQA